MAYRTRLVNGNSIGEENSPISVASFNNELTCKYFVTCISSLTACLICQQHIAEIKKYRHVFHQGCQLHYKHVITEKKRKTEQPLMCLLDHPSEHVTALSQSKNNVGHKMMSKYKHDQICCAYMKSMAKFILNVTYCFCNWTLHLLWPLFIT